MSDMSADNMRLDSTQDTPLHSVIVPGGERMANIISNLNGKLDSKREKMHSNQRTFVVASGSG